VGQTPVETTENYYRFQINVEPSKPVSFDVTERKIVEHNISLVSIGNHQLNSWLQTNFIDRNCYDQLMKLQHMIQERVQMQSKLQQAEYNIQSYTTKQARLRENIITLRGTDDELSRVSRQRFVKEMSESEDEIQRLTDEVTTLKKDMQEKVKELGTSLESLSFEHSIEPTFTQSAKDSEISSLDEEYFNPFTSGSANAGNNTSLDEFF
jgi:predicted nuclease with TOPRIM domain